MRLLVALLAFVVPLLATVGTRQHNPTLVMQIVRITYNFGTLAVALGPPLQLMSMITVGIAPFAGVRHVSARNGLDTCGKTFTEM